MYLSGARGWALSGAAGSVVSSVTRFFIASMGYGALATSLASGAVGIALSYQGYRFAERFNTAARRNQCLSYRLGVQDTLMSIYKGAFHWGADHLKYESARSGHCKA